MPALTCQLTCQDACGAAGAWTRGCVASVGLMPILLKCAPLLYEQFRRDCQPQVDHLPVSPASPLTPARRWQAWTRTTGIVAARRVVPVPTTPGFRHGGWVGRMATGAATRRPRSRWRRRWAPRPGPKTFRSDWTKGSTWDLEHKDVGLVVSDLDQVTLSCGVSPEPGTCRTVLRRFSRFPRRIRRAA